MDELQLASKGTKKWYLISEDDVKNVREALQEARDDKDRQCNHENCPCVISDTLEEKCSKYLTDALHVLDSGLHVTESVPSDYLKLTS